MTRANKVIWDISETAPRDGTTIVGGVWYGTGWSWIADGYFNGDDWYFESWVEDSPDEKPTHWSSIDDQVFVGVIHKLPHQT